MSGKLNLQWNDFKDNIKDAYGKLREDNDFVDVTLACEDGEVIEAHKVILAASSPFFQNILKRSKHPHPIIYMRGVKSSDLEAVINFLYFGEANIFQENLDSFLEIAQELELKGLKRQNIKNVKETHFTTTELVMEMKTEEKTDQFEQNHTNQNDKKYVSDMEDNVADRSIGLVDMKKLDEHVKLMMEKSQMKGSEYICKVCGKEGQGTNMKNHIEANHLEGLSIPCNHCSKTCRSRGALWIHNKRNHKDK